MYEYVLNWDSNENIIFFRGNFKKHLFLFKQNFELVRILLGIELIFKDEVSSTNSMPG